jgi:FkbM family methyltransferase
MVLIKRAIKKIFNSIGLDLIRLSKSPSYFLLGLRSLPIKTIIDVGANTGQFAKMFEKVFPEAKIYCFEPLSDTFKELSNWAESKNNKVKTFNFALGDFEGEIEMFHHIEHSPSSSILKTTQVNESFYPFIKNQSPIKIQQTTLDKAVDSFNTSLIQEILIKLDVQGYEDRVIRGGKKTFNSAKACILEVGLDQLYKGQANFNEITELLYDMGFRYAGNLNQTYANDGHVIFIDAVFVS